MSSSGTCFVQPNTHLTLVGHREVLEASIASMALGIAQYINLIG